MRRALTTTLAFVLLAFAAAACTMPGATTDGYGSSLPPGSQLSVPVPAEGYGNS